MVLGKIRAVVVLDFYVCPVRLPRQDWTRMRTRQDGKDKMDKIEGDVDTLELEQLSVIVPDLMSDGEKSSSWHM